EAPVHKWLCQRKEATHLCLNYHADFGALCSRLEATRDGGGHRTGDCFESLLRRGLILDHLDGYLQLAAQEDTHERRSCADPHRTLRRQPHVHHARLPLGDSSEITHVRKHFLNRALDADTLLDVDHCARSFHVRTVVHERTPLAYS